MLCVDVSFEKLTQLFSRRHSDNSFTNNPQLHPTRFPPSRMTLNHSATNVALSIKSLRVHNNPVCQNSNVITRFQLQLSNFQTVIDFYPNLTINRFKSKSPMTSYHPKQQTPNVYQFNRLKTPIVKLISIIKPPLNRHQIYQNSNQTQIFANFTTKLTQIDEILSKRSLNFKNPLSTTLSNLQIFNPNIR